LPAYLGAILGAEFVFRLLPRGTHDYARFIRPSELERWLRACGMQLMDVTGIRYLPWVDHCTLTNDPTINYIAHARLKD
jgi:2-polyprenyl-6-hydroxyphenyl methylase/3-demethylubiquinone-9 3-methyltransferase